MATKAAHKRLTKEYKAIVSSPTPYIEAHPSEKNILEWHYLLEGPPNTVYEGGQYHGILVFPSDYPFNPPSIKMITPNGRFQTNTRLCLSMSDYHPDLWNPGWSVATILNGLLSFMTGDEPTTGSITTSDETKRKLATASLQWNASDNIRFIKEFDDKVEENFIKIREREEKNKEEFLKKQQSELQSKAKESEIPVIDLSKLDPEDRIRYLAAEQNKSKNSGSRNHHIVYYVLAIAVVLGFFRVVN
ncbi:hypothetical protein WICMUC_003577 [Wickerhamomyces mucosus]|uniref:Ubiquitin-conjugating enzyme E2 6 n=1 Tax=Wickerhamomyces mucosus TaxID=1378264 RepID=A0A9P8PLM7_9ASCO|nr:hypothetical protein WICMUC_003577 [Wickerhamomyces mucosus]